MFRILAAGTRLQEGEERKVMKHKKHRSGALKCGLERG
jgi:hypothetical protein